MLLGKSPLVRGISWEAPMHDMRTRAATQSGASSPLHQGNPSSAEVQIGGQHAKNFPGATGPGSGKLFSHSLWEEALVECMQSICMHVLLTNRIVNSLARHDFAASNLTEQGTFQVQDTSHPSNQRASPL